MEKYKVIVNYDMYVSDMVRQAERYSFQEEMEYDDCPPNNVLFEQHHGGSGIAQLDMSIVQLDKEIEGWHETCHELNAMNLRPATFKELISFCGQYDQVLEVGKEIEAIGSKWRFWNSTTGHEYVAVARKFPEPYYRRFLMERFSGAYPSSRLLAVWQ